METNVANYDLPDFGPDDDTEDMTGVSIYHKEDVETAEPPDLCILPELPDELRHELENS